MVEGVQARVVVIPQTKLVPMRLINTCTELTQLTLYRGEPSWLMQKLLMKVMLVL